ncbi:MAG: oligosaccharide flippase family protein [Desulfomonilaceae bacterium]|nr:oligosaccharide flippase family protein [Desulfomonilaceae bacterium]
MQWNVVANYFGAGWQALLGLCFAPVFIKMMGIEAYGLVGLVGAIKGFAGVMDLGVGFTLNRELARLSVVENGRAQSRDMVRTVEMLGGLVSAVVLVGLILLASPLSQHWINHGKLSQDTVHQAMILGAVAIGLHWPVGFYTGGLLGLQRQVLAKAITAVTSTVRYVGTVCLLWLGAPTIQVFLACQIFMNLIETAVLGAALWLSLPMSGHTARFRIGLFRDIWRFSSGILGINVIGMVMTRLDKIMLTKLVPLEVVGYYSVATAAAKVLPLLVSPIRIALFPKFAGLIQQDAKHQLDGLYHFTCQLLSAVLIPAGLTLAFFSHEILVLWTRDPSIAGQAGPILTLFAIGTLLTQLMWMPVTLQYAYGWTSLAVAVYSGTLLVWIPSFIMLANRCGGMGAAGASILGNLGMLLVGLPVMHKRLIPGRLGRYIVFGLLWPLTVSLAVVTLGRVAIPMPASSIGQAACIALLAGLASVAVALSSPTLRPWCLNLAGQVARPFR